MANYDIGDTVQATLVDIDGGRDFKLNGFITETFIVNVVTTGNFKQKTVYRINSAFISTFEDYDLVTTRMILVEKYRVYDAMSVGF